MAMAPSATAPAVAAEKLTKNDLVTYLASGCKPRDRWRCAACTILQISLLTDTLARLKVTLPKFTKSLGVYIAFWLSESVVRLVLQDLPINLPKTGAM